MALLAKQQQEFEGTNPFRPVIDKLRNYETPITDKGWNAIDSLTTNDTLTPIPAAKFSKPIHKLMMKESKMNNHMFSQNYRDIITDIQHDLRNKFGTQFRASDNILDQIADDHILGPSTTPHIFGRDKMIERLHDMNRLNNVVDELDPAIKHLPLNRLNVKGGHPQGRASGDYGFGGRDINLYDRQGGFQDITMPHELGHALHDYLPDEMALGYMNQFWKPGREALKYGDDFRSMLDSRAWQYYMPGNQRGGFRNYSMSDPLEDFADNVVAHQFGNEGVLSKLRDPETAQMLHNRAKNNSPERLEYIDQVLNEIRRMNGM